MDEKGKYMYMKKEIEWIEGRKGWMDAWMNNNNKLYFNTDSLPTYKLKTSKSRQPNFATF